MDQNQPATEASEQFTAERDRLFAALSVVTEGGLVEAIAHIGATSVPSLCAELCIDIGLAVVPFPLDTRNITVLQTLGYKVVEAPNDKGEQRFLHISGTIQLFVVEAGSERWTDYLLLRDYLNHDPAAREAVAVRKEEWGSRPFTPGQEAAREQLFIETIDAARRWFVAHHGFAPVEAVARELESLPVSWHISSGWALDLYLGQVGRVHHDVDVLVAREDQLAV